MMKILMTGATGFIGQHLYRHFLQLGHDVHVVVRPSTQIKPLNKAASLIEDNGSTETLAQQVRSLNPEICVHVASCFIGQHQISDINHLVDSNVQFPTRLLEALRHSSCRKLINTGTSWQHFQSDSYNPVNLYAATKQAFEDIARYYHSAHNFKVLTLKLFDTYGPNDNRPKLLATLKKLAFSDETLALSPGEQKIDLLHIDDVIDAYDVALKLIETEASPSWQDYSLYSGQALSLKDLVNQFEVALGKKLNVNFGERPYRDREVMEPWNKGEAPAGWAPKIKLEEGLRRYIHDQ